MIKSKSFKYLDGVVIGRSDLAGSLNLTKEDVNKSLIFKKVQKTFKRIKSIVQKKMIFKMGGSITPSSKIFIRTLYKKKLLQNIETRNVEIKLSNFVIENLDKIIPLIFDFELSWLRFKLNKKNIKKNKLISLDYKKRIREIEKRLS